MEIYMRVYNELYVNYIFFLFNILYDYFRLNKLNNFVAKNSKNPSKL